MSHKLAVLVSGTGSLLEVMIEQSLPIDSVFADRACRGVEIAKEARIYAEVMDRENFRRNEKFDRIAFTREFVSMLRRRGITVVAMSGFMTIFSSDIFEHYAGRLLNIHPSLLPAFKGEHAVRDALEFGAKVTGTTIHIATEVLDEGGILAQEAVRVEQGDTVDTLWERIKQVERTLYPKTIRSFIENLS